MLTSSFAVVADCMKGNKAMEGFDNSVTSIYEGPIGVGRKLHL